MCSSLRNYFGLAKNKFEEKNFVNFFKHLVLILNNPTLYCNYNKFGTIHGSRSIGPVAISRLISGSRNIGRRDTTHGSRSIGRKAIPRLIPGSRSIGRRRYLGTIPGSQSIGRKAIPRLIPVSRSIGSSRYLGTIPRLYYYY